MIDAAELGYTPANLHGGLFLSVQLKKAPNLPPSVCTAYKK